MPHLHNILPADVADLNDDLLRLLDELDAQRDGPPPAGECLPPLDVFETDEAIEVVVDLPGVISDAIRLAMKGSILLVAGEKTPPKTEVRQASSFHLVERGFGRFARAIRLAGSFDAAGARATIVGGELRVRLPKIRDRRGHQIRIPVRDAT